jgi:hypothetical protein
VNTAASVCARLLNTSKQRSASTFSHGLIKLASRCKLTLALATQ